MQRNATHRGPGRDNCQSPDTVRGSLVEPRDGPEYRFRMELTLPRPVTDLALWDRFQAGQITEPEIAGSVVLERWRRSRSLGLSADSPGEPIMQLEGLAQAIESFAPLLATGAPFDAFAMEMAKAGFSGVFCDARGVILSKRIS